MNREENLPNQDDAVDARLREMLGHGPPSDDDPSFRRPTDATIQSYIEGTATKEQTREMWKALQGSESFEREIFSAIQAQEDLLDPDLEAKMAEVEVPKDRFKPHGVRNRQAIEGPSPGLVDRLRDFFWSPGLAYGMAAVLALVLVGNSFLQRSGPPSSIQVFETSPLFRGVTRSGDQGGTDGSVEGGFTEIRLDPAAEYVELRVSEKVPMEGYRWRALLWRIKNDGTREAWDFAISDNRLFHPVDDRLGFPTLRVPAHILEPGLRYELEFIPMDENGDIIAGCQTQGLFFVKP